MPETLQGRRVPDGTDLADYQPGDYGKRGSRWWVCIPTGVPANLNGGWIVTEHDDQTITVSPSIYDAPDVATVASGDLGSVVAAALTQAEVSDAPPGRYTILVDWPHA